MLIQKLYHFKSINQLHAYIELLKPRLSLLVSFSCGFGYVLASNSTIDFFNLIMVCIAAFLVSGASVTVNQILEIDCDSLMERTKLRPLPTARIVVKQAIIFSILVAFIGFSILIMITNFVTVALSIISMIIYSFIYTPLKKVGSIAVLVGAIPGALPPLLGWTAATGIISVEALIIFCIQFIWQFPHFWAIAWVSADDYDKAGFKLLPFGGTKDLKTAFQIMIYTLFLIPLGLLPAKFGITGIDSAIVVTLCGVCFLAQTFALMIDGTRKSAMRIMFGSFFYLPIVQIAYLIDKV